MVVGGGWATSAPRAHSARARAHSARADACMRVAVGVCVRERVPFSKLFFGQLTNGRITQIIFKINKTRITS